MQPRRPGAKALVIHDKKFLVVQRDNNPGILHPNMWNTPGGAIDAGETPEEAVLREIEEEVNIVDPLFIENMGVTTYDDESVVHRFAVRLTTEEFKNVRLVSEGQRLDWFTRTEALRLDISPHFRAYLIDCAEDIEQTLAGATVVRDHRCSVNTL